MENVVTEEFISRTEIRRMGECSAIRIRRLNSLLGSCPSGPFPEVARQVSTTSCQLPLMFVMCVFIAARPFRSCGHQADRPRQV
jgi:hypothetical protein